MPERESGEHPSLRRGWEEGRGLGRDHRPDRHQKRVINLGNKAGGGLVLSGAGLEEVLPPHLLKADRVPGGAPHEASAPPGVPPGAPAGARGSSLS